MGKVLNFVMFFGLMSLAYAEGSPPNTSQNLRAKLYNEANLPTTGPADAKVVLVDFFDYNCPFCRKMHLVVRHAEHCDPHTRIIYRHLPLLGPDSKILAQGALAAHRQGKFRDMHEWLMTEGYGSSKQDVIDHAKEMGLNEEKFIKDMENMATEAVLDNNIETALKLNIRTVPDVLVGNYLVREALEQEDFVKHLERAYTDAKLNMPHTCKE